MFFWAFSRVIANKTAWLTFVDIKSVVKSEYFVKGVF